MRIALSHDLTRSTQLRQQETTASALHHLTLPGFAGCAVQSNQALLSCCALVNH